MNRTTAILLSLAAAVVDGLAALSYAGSLPLGSLPYFPVAIGLHLVAILVCALAVGRFRPDPDKTTKGTATLGLLAAVLTAVAPVAGPLAIAVVLAAFRTPRKDSSGADHIAIGNPLRHVAVSGIGPSEPLVESILNSDIPALRQAGPKLHRQLCPASVNALRSLQVHADPRIQLHSQSALTALKTTAEQQLEKLRRAACSESASTSVHRDLAFLLHHIASSQLHDSIDSDALLNEAVGYLHGILSQNPNDLGSLHLLAQCQLRRGNLQALPAILDILRKQADSEAICTAVEVEYYAAEGRWHSAGLRAQKLATQSTATQLFWQGLRPLASVQ